MINSGHREVLKYLRTATASALGERLGDVDRVSIAVARYVNATKHIIQISEWIQ